MKVFIACECSGVGRRAFIAAGHDVISSDLKECEDMDPRDINYWRHFVGDCFEALADLKAIGWIPDLIIAHPTCTYLSNSGIAHLTATPKAGSKIPRGPERWAALREACEFFNKFKGKARMVCIENPIPHRHATALVGPYTQIVHPYQFGHLEDKGTCLWLEGLPELQETNNVKEEMLKLPVKERQKVWWGGARSKVDRSRSYSGILQAMVDQWGCL